MPTGDCGAVNRSLALRAVVLAEVIAGDLCGGLGLRQALSRLRARGIELGPKGAWWLARWTPLRIALGIALLRDRLGDPVEDRLPGRTMIFESRQARPTLTVEASVRPRLFEEDHRRADRQDPHRRKL